MQMASNTGLRRLKMHKMNLKEFMNYDIIKDPPKDHYFNLQHVAVSSYLARRINKEWRTLNTSLPDSTFVRVFETRIELMRVVIAGPGNTLYQFGLSFFDINFTSVYPDLTPRVVYYLGT